jgi:hypothetical protein
MRFTLLIRYCLLLSVIFIGNSSCKKSVNATKSLLGDWYEQANPAGFSRGLNFGSDGSFSARFTAFPAPLSGGGTSELTTTTFAGTYQVKGDSLLTKITTMTVNQNNIGSVVTPSIQKVFEYATFKVNNGKLTINYTTYPADAPVPTQATYVRFLPD